MSKTQLYIRRGKQDFVVTNNAATDIVSQLPLGVYRLSQVPFVGWVFERIDDFDLPPKLYGKLPQQAERVLSTYEDRLKRDQSTGVLLKGSKGAGKTLLAKKVAIDSGRPVVVINHPYHDDGFKEVIAGLGEVVVIFDEFEKIYHDKSHQNALLTLFDGVFMAKALMFVIVNDSYALVRPLVNRPGRLYYSFNYKGLEREFIQDYCDDRLNNKDHIVGVLSVATMFEEFNFDMLQALVEEMNRYNEPASEAVVVLNIDMDYLNNHTRYEVTAMEMDTGVELDMDGEFHQGHPLTQHENYYFRFHDDGESFEDEEERYYDFFCNEGNLAQVDPETDTFVFIQDGVMVSLTKMEYKSGFSLGKSRRSNYGPWAKDKSRKSKKESPQAAMRKMLKQLEAPIPIGTGDVSGG